MLALYLLASHLVGDFLFQNRWQAATKLTDRNARSQHVLFYALAFVPIALLYDHPWGLGRWLGASSFLVALAVLHWLTDSRRFQSSIGDVVQWKIDRHVDPQATAKVWVDFLYGDEASGTAPYTTEQRLAKARNLTDSTLRWPPPNPWPAMPLMIDQSLHVCQLALLGGLLLR